MTSHQSNEERPRITITAERHDELVAAEVRLKELHGAGLSALETVGRTMIELSRARQAGRRLAKIHKVKLARVDKLLLRGIKIVRKAEVERDKAVEEADDAKGREMGLTGVLNKLSDKYRLLKQSKGEEGKHADPHGRIVDTAKLHLDFKSTTEWFPNKRTSCGPPQVVHAICDGSIKPDFFVDRDGTIEDLNNMFTGGGTITAWIYPWEKCYEARRLAEHWRAAWSALYGSTVEKFPWEEVTSLHDGQIYEEHFSVARMLAERWRDRCEEHCPTFAVFPWEKDDGNDAE